MYSIIVVTWNCANALATLVDSLNEYLSGSEQLIVVDNASGDDPAAAARRWRGPLELVLLPQNRGFGVAVNEGVRQTNGETVVILNPDTWLVDGSLGQLAAAASERRALVGPRVLNPDGSIQPSASGPLVGAWPWVRALWPGAVAPATVKAKTEPWRLEQATKVTWLTASCIAAPRDVLLELGPFDESLHLYSEDLELGLRAARTGVASWFLPDVARVVHVGDVSSSLRFADGGLSEAAANARLVLTRELGETQARQYFRVERFRLRLRVALKAALRLPHARDTAALAAVRDAARSEH